MKTFKYIFTIIMLWLTVFPTNANIKITTLRVQNIDTPLAVEEAYPSFSWRMTSDEHGVSQQAYKITVTDATGTQVWDSGKINSSLSHAVRYQGTALSPETHYDWQLSVWDNKGDEHRNSSWFETSLMNPDIDAWYGAKWIGTKQNNLNATTNYYFDLSTTFQITRGDKASMIIGANDFRLLDKTQNVDGLEGENYIRIEFDLSQVNDAAIRVFRIGYAPYDSAVKPVIEVNKATQPNSNINKIFTSLNKNNRHNVRIHVENGNMTFQIDNIYLSTAGTMDAPTFFNLTPWGQNDYYNTIFRLNQIGFAAMPNSSVTYSDYTIYNIGKSKNNVVFNKENYESTFKNLKNVTLQGENIIVNNNSNVMTIDYADPSHGSLTMLRSDFNIPEGKRIKSARLYATAQGAYVAYLNGNRVGNDWFAPGACQYRKIMGYQIYDVTDFIKPGNNAIGAILNSGWYTGYMTNEDYNFNFYGDNEAFMGLLNITFTDRSQQKIVTNTENWKVYKNGPVRFGSFFMGERYDANYETAIKDWNKTGYNASAWFTPDIINQRDWMQTKLMARYDDMIQIRDTINAKELMPVHNSTGTTFIYNMGTNMTGVPSIIIPAGYLKAGDQVILRYSEQLYPGFKGDDDYYRDTYGPQGNGLAGSSFHENYRIALATDFYTAKDGSSVLIQPSTTYRCYQYVQITLPSGCSQLPLENVRGLVLSSDKKPTGSYIAETNDTETTRLVNQLFTNIQRSQMGNFLTLPTDCPQRNERMGWTGDAQAYCRTASYNSDVFNFFRQWMVSLRSEQGNGGDWSYPGGVGFTIPSYTTEDMEDFPDGTTWGAAVCMVPWQLYTQYGNTDIIEENFEAMRLWLDGMEHFDFSSKYPELSSKTTGLADWLAQDENTPSELVNNAIYIYMMEVTAKMADAIGETEYATVLRKRHAKAKAQWNLAYVDPSNGRTKNVDGRTVHSQSSYATPLAFNCFSDENLVKAQSNLAQLAANPANSGNGNQNFKPYTITTGFSGTPNILPALSRAGYHTIATRMFTCKDFTSWLYPVSKGATSIWEHWNGFENAFGANKQNGMNSFNHFALGAVGQWMYEYQLGITNNHEQGEASYHHFILQPNAGDNFILLKGSFDSSYGVITSEWKADGKGVISNYTCIIPANTTATLFLPIKKSVTNANSHEYAKFKGFVFHNGQNCAQYELCSGSYEFSINSTNINIH